MSTPSASRAERILVWDAPVRVFHWLMVLGFAGAWVTGDSERWRLLHVTLGYTLAGLVVFRLLWGLFGTRHARFASFVRGPGAALRYLGSVLRGHPEHHTGHNPAGALAIVALLALTLVAVASGWATENGFEALEDVHEGAVNLMLALVFVHVAAVLASSWLHRENLVRAMITGKKRGEPRDAIRGRWRSVAALLLAAVLGFWAWQWDQAPTAGDALALQADERPDGPRERRRDRDDH
jgi:cytochrome b